MKMMTQMLKSSNKILKIVLISDTHLRYEAINIVKEKYPDADYLVHCGDFLVPDSDLNGFIAVKGNWNGISDLPEERILEIGNFRVLIFHSHTVFDTIESYYNGVAKYAKSKNCNVVFFGHSHLYYDNTIDGIRLLNPGAIQKSRDSLSGTYMELTIENNKITAERKDYRKLAFS